MDRLQGSLVQAAIKRLVKEFKFKVRTPFVLFFILPVVLLALRLFTRRTDHRSPLDDLDLAGRYVWSSSCCRVGAVRSM